MARSLPRTEGWCAEIGRPRGHRSGIEQRHQLPGESINLVVLCLPTRLETSHLSFAFLIGQDLSFLPRP